MTIVSPNGVKYHWNKPTPPTPEDMRALMLRDQANFQAPGMPEAIRGSSPDSVQQRQEGLQNALDLPDPIDEKGRLPVKDRFWMGLATPGQKKAYFDIEYGEGNYAPLTNDKALVRILDEKGQRKWVVDNPSGLDAGDVAQVAAKAPEIMTGILASTAKMPGAHGLAAKTIMASGAGAIVSNLTGAAADTFYRLSNNLPVDVPDIAKRRSLGAALESLVGFAVPYGLGRIAQNKPVKEALGAFYRSAKEAKKSLIGAGINPRSVAEIPDAILAQNQAGMSAVDAGEAIAKVVSKTDQNIQAASGRMLNRAAGDVAQRAESRLAAATSGPVSMGKAGQATVGAIGQFIDKSKKAVGLLYESAYKQIDDAVRAAGQGRKIIELKETEAVVDDLLAARLVDDAGEPIKLGTALASSLQEIKRASGAVQKLEAVRNLRSQLAANFRGSGAFPELGDGVSKQLYGTLSKDIDRSVAELTGPGAAALKQANAAYKQLIEPFEKNTLLGKTADAGWQNGEDMVRAFASAGPQDWSALKAAMPVKTYAEFRRAVAGNLMGGDPVVVSGREYANVAGLGKRLSALTDEVKDEIFGNQAAWRGLEKLGREQEWIASRQGLFSSPRLPTKETIEEAVGQMRAGGFDQANRFLSRAAAAQEARINSLHGALVSQMRGGNFGQAARDPVAVLEALGSGKYSGSFVSGVLAKMPGPQKEQVQRAALARVFELTKDKAQSIVSGKTGHYDFNHAANVVLGNPQQRQAAEALLGPDKYKLVEDWTRVALETQIELAKGGKIAHIAGRLLSVLPYGKLLMARIGQEAIESAAGRRLISGISPEYAALFAQSRQAVMAGRSATANVILQKAVSHPLFKDYEEMMSPYSPEQQLAIDAFLLGQN